MKKILTLLLSFTLILGLTSCSSKEEVTATPDTTDETATIDKYKSYLDDSNPTATIKFKDYGVVEIELFPEIAPYTVDNFISLAEDGFYDGLSMHRIIKGFMIQGGDPQGNGTGGSEDKIIGEFSSNGVENPLSHTRGVLSMARSSEPNSASSQFFIVHQDSNFLDGDYAAFGAVTKGFSVVDKIAELETDSNDKPTTDVIIENVTIANHNSNIINNEKFLNDKNPVATITYSNDVKLELQLLPEVAEMEVNNFIKLVTVEYYKDNNINLYSDNLGLVTTTKNDSDFFIPTSTNKVFKTEKAVVMFNDYGVTNTGSASFIILNGPITENFAAFALVTKGYEDLNKITEDVTIKDITLDLKDYKPIEPTRTSNVFKSPTEFLDKNNRRATVTLSNGKSFVIELFDNIAPKTTEYFVKNISKIEGKQILPVAPAAEASVTSYVSEGFESTDVLIDSETVLNSYENNIAFDKYTLGLLLTEFDKTNGSIIFTLDSVTDYNMFFPVFAYVVENKEVVDTLSNIKVDEEGNIIDPISIKSIKMN